MCNWYALTKWASWKTYFYCAILLYEDYGPQVFPVMNDLTVFETSMEIAFSNFSCMFLNPNIFFSNLNANCSNLLDMRNLQENVKKAFCYQKLFWPFTVWTNCSSDLKNFANSRPSASNFKSFSRSLELFFLTVGHNNFGNKIPILRRSFLKQYFVRSSVDTIWWHTFI